MEQRYLQLDTQIISKENPLLSDEFQNLTDKTVIARIPVETGVVVFIMNTDNQIEYALFTRQSDDTFSGTFVVADTYVSFEDCTNLHILSGYYDKNETFYLFYNRIGNVYLRTFLFKQGLFSDEILVKETGDLESIKNVKEAYLLMVKDDRFDAVNVYTGLSGEMKVLTVFEKNIIRYIDQLDTVLSTSEIENPFHNIAENLWSCKDLTENDQSFLYLANQNVRAEYHSESINGYAFAYPGDIAMKMNEDVNEYTFTMRFGAELTAISAVYVPLVQTENYTIKYKSAEFPHVVSHKLQVIDIHGIHQYTIPDITDNFINLSVTVNVIEDQYVIAVYWNNTLKHQKYYALPDGYTTDSVMRIKNVRYLDYISLKNNALVKNAVLDVHKALSKDLLLLSETKTLTLDYALLNNVNYNNTSNPHVIPILPIDGEVDLLSSYCSETLVGIPPLSGAFIDNQDNTVSYFTPQKMWSQTYFTPEYIPQTSYASLPTFIQDQASASEHAGYTNWRIPTLSEMQSISAASGFENGVDKVFNWGTHVWMKIETTGTYNVWRWNDFTFPTYYYWEFIPLTLNAGRMVLFDFTRNAIQIPDKYYRDYVLVRDIQSEIEIRFSDSLTCSSVATVSGSTNTYTTSGVPYLWRNTLYSGYSSYSVDITFEEAFRKNSTVYTKNYKLNSANRYMYGTRFALDRDSVNEELDAIVPIFLTKDTGIPNKIFSDPEENLRVCENISQQYDLSPFIIDSNGDTVGFTVWTSLKKFNDSVSFQYVLKDKDLRLSPTYARYDVLSNNLYKTNDYFCAYHFDRLLDQRHLLVRDMTVDVSGEIIIGGNTESNSYIREINGIRFFDNPERYKSTDFKVSVDISDVNDRESYINNEENVRQFIEKIIKLWKPVTANLTDIEEKNTLIMARLLKDEFTQVLVGFTPHSNTNAYYIRSVDTGEVNLLTSSSSVSDQVDWVGVGRIDTPYIKSGVTKIKNSAKNVKIYFETSFTNTKYRIFVFSPNNTKYYVPIKDKDGFIVESSYLVEEEVAWIALNTNQITNGTVVWKRGVPTSESLVDNMDREQEVNVNSHKYVLNFSEYGFPNFSNTDYSVILSSDSNINLWVDDKTTISSTIRRSYSGNDTTISFLAVPRNTKWWKQITA